MIRKLLLLVTSLFQKITQSEQIASLEIKRRKISILNFCLLFLAFFCSNTQIFAQSGTVTSNNTGNWSDAPTWSAVNINRTGTVTSSNASTTVTGNGTLFLTELTVGSVITRQNGTAIGTVASIASNTSLTLTANATNNVGNQTYRTISGPPSPVDSVIIGNNHTVTVNGTYSCAAINIGTSNFNMAILNFLNSGSQLTVTDFTLGGNNVNRPGTLDMTNGGTLIANTIALGNNTAANVFTPGSGTVQLAANDVLPATIFTTFNNLSISAGTTTMAVGLTINGNLNISNAATLNTTTSNYSLNLRGNFTNNGTFTANGSPITLAGTANQSIAGFTTTGIVSMTKTGGTATFTGNVSSTGTALTINGTGGTLNLGTRLSHTFSTVTLTNGTLNGGSSTINLSATNPFSGPTANFLPATGTVNLNGAAQNTMRVTFYNLTLSGTGVKTFSTITTIANVLTISNTVAKGNLANFGVTHTAAALITAGSTRIAGVYGGAPGAPISDSNYFTNTAGTVTIGTNSCTSFAGVAPITSVQLNTLSNAPAGAESSTTAYELFAPTGTATTTVNKGDYYSLIVKGNTSGDFNMYYTAFFDWNNDGDYLDTDEGPVYIGTIRNSSGTDGKTTSVYYQIPTGATSTSVKMRIIGRLGNYNTTPCTVNTDTGQVEDYTITLQAGCSGTLPSTVSTSSTASTVCPNVPFTLSLGNTFGDGATYIWETSPNGNAPWTSAATPSVAFFNSTFSTDQAINSTVGNIALSGNDTSITGGELILTDVALGGHNGGFLIDKANTANITPFTATFKYRIWDGGTLGADGMSLSYGSNLPANAGGGESGEGSGLVVQFDTYDNEGVADGSRVRILYNNAPIFNTAINAPFNLRTSIYRDVNLNVDTDGYLTLVIQKQDGTMVTVVSKLLLPGFAAADKSTWKFKFSARTGGSKDKHSIDDLNITFLDSANSKAKFTTSQTTKTYYRATITCGGTVISTPVFVDMTSAVITTQPTAPTAVCSGAGVRTITVAATGASLTYSWRLGGVAVTNGGVYSGQGTNTLTLTNPIAANAGNYDVVITGACSSTVTSNAVALTVNPLPTPTFTAQPATSPCIGTSVTYTTETGMTNYTWGFPGVAGTNYTIVSGGTTGSNTVTLRYLTAGSKTVTINYTNGNSCTATAATSSSAVTVNALPTPTFTAQPVTSPCIGTSVTYTTETGMTNYTWGFPGVAGTDYTIVSGGTTGSNTVTLRYLTAGSKTVTINYTNGNGCTAASATSSSAVTVNALPTPTFTAQPGASTCISTSVTYTTETGMTNYTWGFPGVAGTDYTIVSGGTTTDNTVTLRYLTAGSKTVTINYTNGNGCTAASATSSSAVTVNALPTPTFTAQPGASTCIGTSVTYTTETGMTNYTWVFPGTAGTDYAIVSGGTTGTNTVTLRYLTAGSKTVTINYTNGNGCTAA
ncbi:S-layer family protein, partial [Flavobacterium sp. LC2016-13]